MSIKEAESIAGITSHPRGCPVAILRLGYKSKKAPKTYQSDGNMRRLNIQLLEHEQVFWKTSVAPPSPPLPSALTDGVGHGNLESQPSLYPVGCGEAGSAAASACPQLLQSQTLSPALCRQVTLYSTASPLDPWWIVSCITHLAK